MARWQTLVAITLWAAACQPDPEDAACDASCGDHASCDPVVGRCYCDPGHAGDPEAGCEPHGDLCGEAAAREGHSVCRHEVPDVATWNLLSIGQANDGRLRRGAKYLVPAEPDVRLPTLVQDTNWYRIHYCVMAQGFPTRFPGLEYGGYQRLVLEGASRELYGGTIAQLNTDEGDAAGYAFTVETLATEAELLSVDAIYDVYRQLQDRFDAGPLSYLPDSPVQEQQAATWADPPFPIADLPPDPGPQYEAYTPGLAYGRIRRFTDAELLGPDAPSFGWQDIIVVDHPPLSLEGVMAASITATRQDVLTHLNVLSSIRGTPNVLVADALDVFEPYDGALVRLEALPTYYSVREATAGEAQAHWAQARPKAELRALPDPEFVGLPDLDSIEVGDAAARTLAVSRFGSKVTGLAVLRDVADTGYIVRGFGIPVSAYFAFMTENTWSAPVDGGTATLSYADTIGAWLDDDAFRSDATVRASRLSALRAHMEDHGVVDPALLAELRTRIAEVFGDANLMVRMRSSSNAEDSLSFNGAGLYESRSACGPDAEDAAVSACDPTRGAQPLDEALRTVWASLWRFGAFEERDYYQLDHAQVAMGVLVNPRFADEQANGVAFTGNPSDVDDPRMTINVQLGELDVVSPSAGVVAELDRVTVQDGSVTAIDRVIGSSEVPTGTWVLDDARVGELARLLADIAAVYPIDGEPPAGTTVMLDVEFKIDADGDLVLKQIRPFAANPYEPGHDLCP